MEDFRKCVCSFGYPSGGGVGGVLSWQLLPGVQGCQMFRQCDV